MFTVTSAEGVEKVGIDDFTCDVDIFGSDDCRGDEAAQPKKSSAPTYTRKRRAPNPINDDLCEEDIIVATIEREGFQFWGFGSRIGVATMNAHNSWHTFHLSKNDTYKAHCFVCDYRCTGRIYFPGVAGDSLDGTVRSFRIPDIAYFPNKLN